MKKFRTYQPRPSTINRRWYVVDARDQVLGRLAAGVARVLQGKHRPTYAPHLDTGDHVVIINAAEVRLTGRKAEQKTYQYYTGWSDGRKLVAYGDLARRKPGEALKLAVKRMLPKTKLGRQMLGKLQIYAGDKHPHEAQKPEPLVLPGTAARAASGKK